MKVKSPRWNGAVARCRAIFAKYGRRGRAAAFADCRAAGINEHTIRTTWQRWADKYDEELAAAIPAVTPPRSLSTGTTPGPKPTD